MITWEKMTDEQRTRYLKFKQFYTEDTIKMFQEILSESELETKSQKYYESYQRIVNKTAILMRELRTEQPLFASIVFEYLLWGGYLSESNNLKYTLSDRINNLTIPGADIMRGKSVCLNNADMLADILKSLNHQAYPVACYIPKKLKMSQIKKPNIERQVEQKVSNSYKLAAKVMSIFMKKIGNHAVTFIKSDDKFYISDPTNLAFANVSDFLKMQYIGTTLDVQLMPWLSLVIGGMTEQEFTHLFLEAMVLSDKPSLDDISVTTANGLVEELCYENRQLLCDFHDDINEDIIIVSKTLNKAKNII